jgi:hypothetical protein
MLFLLESENRYSCLLNGREPFISQYCAKCGGCDIAFADMKIDFANGWTW